ncbi:MAG: TatD family hydrolase [Acidimicrobiales bacterium]
MNGDGVRFADSHCHLAYGPDDDPVDVAVAAAAEAGVLRLIDVGTNRATSLAALQKAAGREGVYATVGLHPHDASDGTETLADLVDAPGVTAIGECGLDYHYDNSPREVQREAFATQVGWANERDLPLVIHSRDAWDDTFAVLDDVGVPARTVFHCFTGGPVEATRALERGAHLSFSGIVTFRNAADVRAAAALCPPDRVLVETDAPYLAPVPNRGRPNRPAWLPFVAAGLAEARGETTACVAGLTWRNTERVFGLG